MTFKVRGPFPLAIEKISDAANAVRIRCVKKEGSLQICRRHQEVRDAEAGVYVFAVRKSGGAGLPWYVGITEIDREGALIGECFTADKLRKYALGLAMSGSGTPILYFLLPTDLRSDGVVEIESFLIWLARQRNPQLINRKKVKLTPASLNGHLKDHKIAGMLNASRGNPGPAVPKFKSMIGWGHTMHVVSD